MDRILFTDGILEVVIQLAPTLLLLIVLFIIFSWLRLLIDAMSGRGL